MVLVLTLRAPHLRRLVVPRVHDAVADGTRLDARNRSLSASRFHRANPTGTLRPAPAPAPSLRDTIARTLSIHRRALASLTPTRDTISSSAASSGYARGSVTP